MIGPRGSLTRAELFTFVALGLIGAAVFAPQLMQAANAADAAQALADVRTVSRAEQAYAAANAGFYSDVVMLCSTGPDCRGISIPGYTGPDFLPAELGRRSPFLKDSYAHHWTAQHPPNTLPASAAPHSVVDYCYVTAPWVTAPIPRSEWPPAFGVDGSGRIFVDRQGVDIACPVPVSTETWDNPRPALAVDFGRRGLWRYDGNDRWIKLARSNPALVHAWGERLLSTFEGKKGLFLLDETGWRRIHPRRPTEIVPMPEGVAVRFRNQAGVWYWDETAWVQLAPWEPEAMETQGNKLLIDFGREGVWLFWEPIGMTQISDRDPSYVFAGNDYYLIDLADGQGLQAAYVISLPERNLWWEPSRWPKPEALLEYPRRFGGNAFAEDLGVSGGIRVNYRPVSPWDPYLLAHLDGDLVVAVRGLGLYRFENNTDWIEVTPFEPSELAPANGYIGARFDGLKGLYRVHGTGTQRLTGWKTQSVTPVDLVVSSQSWQLRRARQCPVPKVAADTCQRLVRRRGWP